LDGDKEELIVSICYERIGLPTPLLVGVWVSPVQIYCLFMQKKKKTISETS
jgi:hypothetical protein